MGTVNFLRKLCVGISGVAAPLSRLGSEKVPFKWTKECKFAFCQIKNLFTEAPLLRHADPTKQFILETDASNYAYAGVLLQEFEGKEHPISYYSGKFNDTEFKYPVHDKELYAVIGGLTHWRHHCQGTKIQDLSDQKIKASLYLEQSKNTAPGKLGGFSSWIVSISPSSL